VFTLILLSILLSYLLALVLSGWLFGKLFSLIFRKVRAYRIGFAIGIIAGLAPVFWDVIPTFIAHRYLCSRNSGTWIYKTPEQWLSEKRNQIAKLAPRKIESEKERETSFNWKNLELSRRWLDEKTIKHPEVLSIQLETWRIVDRDNHEILVEHSDYTAWRSSIKYWRYELLQGLITGCPENQKDGKAYVLTLQRYESLPLD
jgi:hypothetical protein